MNKRLFVSVLVPVIVGLCVLIWNQVRIRAALDHLEALAATGEKTVAARETVPAIGSRVNIDDVYAAAEIGELREAITRMTAEMGELRATIEELESRGVSGRFASSGLQWLDGGLTNEEAMFGVQASQAYAEKGRAWGPEQVVGEPDTPGAGDIATAWAPLKQDGGEEWLQLDYDQPVELSEINVIETHNPGAISRVTAVLDDGREHVIWEGNLDPEQAPIERAFQVHDSLVARSVRIHLDTTRVSGWNEIDAVELIGRDQSRQWAVGANASSTYAEQ